MIELAIPGFHIVLYQPEIPANTGNIGRLCLGANSTLHLVKPLRFLLDDKSLKRAGLDYWPELNVVLHEGLQEILDAVPREKLWLCTTKASVSYLEQDYRPGDCFIFGPESRGLPDCLLAEYADRCVTIPMAPRVRSVNLSNSVAIILYEAVRQVISRAV